MSKKITDQKSELKRTACNLNILIDNLRMLVMCLENPTIMPPSKLSVHCQEFKIELIVYRDKVLQLLEMGA